MIKVHWRHLGQCQQSSGCASNGAPGASQPWVRAGWVWSWTMPIWGVLGALLISPAWRSSALINVALGLVRFPMFQHLTGCNLIFPLHTHDGSEPAQVKFVFDSTAGLLPRFTTTEKSPKSQFFLSSDIYGTAIVGEMLIQLDTVLVKWTYCLKAYSSIECVISNGNK